MGVRKSMKDAVHNALTNCKPGNELETLVQTLKHDVQPEVLNDMLAAFQSYYPGRFESDQLHLFGSHVMGLAFKDSDLDIYVELPNCEQEKSKNARNKKIRNSLERSRKFTNFESITKPRVPLIRCTHISTLTNCDFNSSNQLGSFNSPIIAHLLQFDHRIHKLAILIKYWMKVHDCSGMNRISNYAITWMLIFYLQTLPQPIVPPIEEFQRNVPPTMVSHYNFAFDYSMPNKTKNQSKWPELLLGFFKFYRDFDYDTQVICPLYGKTFSKTDVEQKKLTEFQRYEQILLTGEENAMYLDKNNFCIQDPFEITRKVPGMISMRNHEKILLKIGYAAEILERELRKGDRKSILLQIFDEVEFEQYVNKNAKIIKKRKTNRVAEQNKVEGRRQKTETDQNDAAISRTSNLYITCGIKMNLQLKPTDFVFEHDVWKNVVNNCSVQSDTHLMRKMWAKEIIEMIPDVLRDIFKLQLHSEKCDTYMHNFRLTGSCCTDMFLERKKSKSVSDDMWSNEVQESSKRFETKSLDDDVPLKLYFKIAADVENFEYISMEVGNQILTKDKSHYYTFCHEFLLRINFLLTIYFVHRNKMANSDATTTMQDNSASTLPSTQVVAQVETYRNSVALKSDQTHKCVSDLIIY